jgi:uncharacterized delta-60 repeat protein
LLTVVMESHSGSRDFKFKPPFSATTAAFLVLPNDQLLVAAYRNTIFLDVILLNQDGNVDPTFRAEASGSIFLGFHALARQPDGKILIGRPFNAANGVARNGVARLNPDGSLDETFDAQSGPGYPTISSMQTVNRITLQSDGLILVVGYFSLFNQIPRLGIARLLPNGDLDESFDPGRWIDPSAIPPFLQCAAVQPDGRILLGGQFLTLSPRPLSDVARFNADGTPDFTFDTGSGADAMVNTIALQSDGEILIGGGFSQVDGQVRHELARLSSSGHLEAAFIPEWTVPSNDQGVILGLAVQADGKILVGGSGVRTTQHAALARLNPDGTVDRSFAPDLINDLGSRATTVLLDSLSTRPDTSS